jgi:NADPH-dependent 2,4-dienoyl-CoA reductase/sulfur reductase-like enzyme
MKFVVIGGDAAGMSAASRAKRRDPKLAVTVLEQSGDVSYSACGMPYNIADADREIEDLVVRPAEVFRSRQDIDLRTGHRVESIDPAARTVAGIDGDGKPFRIPYDKLLFATGGRPVLPGIEGQDLPGVFCLKSLEDGRRIKAFLTREKVRRVVILGMGYIALEMAEALRTRGIAVAMVKPGPVLLPWMAADLSAVVQEELLKNDVRLYPGEAVSRIESSENGLMVHTPQRKLPAQLVLVAVGIRPNAEIAKAAGIRIGAGGAIAVNTRQQTSEPDIYAAGDCAEAKHVVTGDSTWIPLALRANRAGWAVADAVCGHPVELEGVAGTAVFKVFGLEVARTGLSLGEALQAGFEPAESVVTTRSRAHAHPGAVKIRVQMVGDRKSGRLLGTQMVGPEGVAHRINAAAVALHNRMTVSAFSQLDLSYAPPFGPVWDPLLTAANQLLKKLG